MVVALDEHMEMLMHPAKTMPNNGSFGSWVQMSKQLSVCMRCKSMVGYYCSRRNHADAELAERLTELGDKTAVLLSPRADPTLSYKTKKTNMLQPIKHDSSDRATCVGWYPYLSTEQAI